MKYCNTCGNLIQDRARKCSNCGTKISKKYRHNATYSVESQPSKVEYSKKSVFTSKVQEKEINFLGSPLKKSIWVITPFFLIPGVGFMYAGKWKKGFIFLSAFIITVIVDVITKVNGLWAFIGLTSTVYLTLMIWGIVGAVKSIRAHNEEVEVYDQKSKPMKDSDFTLVPGK